jgi:hypothetical protein
MIPAKLPEGPLNQPIIPMPGHHYDIVRQLNGWRPLRRTKGLHQGWRSLSQEVGAVNFRWLRNPPFFYKSWTTWPPPHSERSIIPSKEVNQSSASQGFITILYDN